MSNLSAIIKETNELTEKLTEKLSAMPKNQTCTHSCFPDKMWCNLLNIITLYSICDTCPKYKPMYVNIKN